MEFLNTVAELIGVIPGEVYAALIQAGAVIGVAVVGARFASRLRLEFQSQRVLTNLLADALDDIELLLKAEEIRCKEAQEAGRKHGLKDYRQKAREKLDTTHTIKLTSSQIENYRTAFGLKGARKFELERPPE